MPLHLGSVLAGLATRCPRCWRGRMFRSFFRMRPSCAECGYDFGMGRGEFTGAMMIAQFLWGGIALYGYFFLIFFGQASVEVQVAWVAGFGLLLPLLTYRNIKGFWAGLIYAGEELEMPGVRQRGPPLGQR